MNIIFVSLVVLGLLNGLEADSPSLPTIPDTGNKTEAEKTNNTGKREEPPTVNSPADPANVTGNADKVNASTPVSSATELKENATRFQNVSGNTDKANASMPVVPATGPLNENATSFQNVSGKTDNATASSPMVHTKNLLNENATSSKTLLNENATSSQNVSETASNVTVPKEEEKSDSKNKTIVSVDDTGADTSGVVIPPVDTSVKTPPPKVDITVEITTPKTTGEVSTDASTVSKVPTSEETEKPTTEAAQTPKIEAAGESYPPTSDLPRVQIDDKIKEPIEQVIPDIHPKDVVPTGEEQVSGSNFPVLFMVSILAIVGGYFLYHNKSKIMGLIVEGRGPGGSRRTATRYNRLRNVEEAMPGMRNKISA